VLSGTPTRPETHSIPYRVRTGEREVASGTAVIRVLLTGPSPGAADLVVSGRVGEPLAAVIPYRGLVEPVALTASGPLPKGLNWSATALEGTPETPGTASVPVTMTDGIGTVVRTTLTIRVWPSKAASLFQIAVPDTLDLPVGMPFSWKLSTVGGLAPAEVRLSGTSPPGCVLDKGVLTATMTEPGRWTLKLTATDPLSGEVASREMIVRSGWEVFDRLQVATTTLPAASVGEEYSVALAAKDAAGPVSWQVIGVLPEGLALKDGILSGKVVGAGRGSLCSR
jgi:hypothetical protein